MSIKLLALDLDGTLFGDDLFISDRTRSAIQGAQEAGVLVTIATGRMFVSAAQIAANLHIDAPLICYQGALIRDTSTKEILYHKTIPLHLAQEIITGATDEGVHLNLYLNDEIFAARITPGALFYSKINMDIRINEVGDLESWLRGQHGAEPTKLVIITDPEQTDQVLAHFTQLYGSKLQVTKSHPRFTEFTNIECSKGRALAFLARYCNVDRGEVMAIGDGLNDLDMIEWAGHGVAMGTSPEAVLKVARTVCPALNEDGAADAIERFVLNAPRR